MKDNSSEMLVVTTRYAITSHFASRSSTTSTWYSCRKQDISHVSLKEAFPPMLVLAFRLGQHDRIHLIPRLMLYANVIAPLALINAALLLSLTKYTIADRFDSCACLVAFLASCLCSFQLLSLCRRESTFSCSSIEPEHAVPPVVLDIMVSLWNALNTTTSGG